MDDSILFASNAEAAAQVASAALARQGFRVMRSFDMQSALAAHADCACPYHGTAECACQFIVLLAYGEAGHLVVVTAHSRGGQARLRVVRDEMPCLDPRLAAQVMVALVEAAVTLQPAAIAGVAADGASAGHLPG